MIYSEFCAAADGWTAAPGTAVLPALDEDGKLRSFYSTALYGFTSKIPLYRLWGFNILRQRFRQLESAVDIGYFAVDHNGDLIAYDDTTQKLASFTDRESVRVAVRRNGIVLSTDREEPIRWLEITYRCEKALTVNLYAEGSSTPDETFTLPVRRSLGTEEIYLGWRARKIDIEITGGSGSMTTIEIASIKLIADDK